MPRTKKNLGVQDPELAQRLSVEGAIFVVLDVPPGTEFGIDLNSWNTGEKFCGVKMIPPGIHFVYYSSVNLATRSTAPRTGFFHNFSRGDVVVRRWDKTTEDIVESSDEEQARVKADRLGIDHRLGVYPYESWSKWISLSNRLSEATLRRLEPISGKVCSVADLVPDDTGKPEVNDSSSIPGLPAMTARPGTSIRFTSLDLRKYPEGSNAGEITKHCMDSTFQLTRLLSCLEKLYGDQVSGGCMSGQNLERELLAELQFAFLSFLVGQNYDSFEQWKKLVVMLCTCDEGLVTHPDLFRDFLGDLYFQMKEVPRDFFVDIVSSNNFLSTCLYTLFTNIKDSENVGNELKERSRKFEANVTKRFGWDFSTEVGEDGPVIVE